MPKGGRSAAAAHNARVRAPEAVPVEVAPVVPNAETGERTRAAARRPVDRFAFGPWGVAASIAAGVVLERAAEVWLR